MKKFLSIFSSVLLLSIAFLNTGCEDDPVVDPIGPDFDVTDPLPASVVEEAGTFVLVTVTGSKGTEDLESITVYEGSTKLSIDDFTVDGTLAAANPFTVDATTVDHEIGIKVNAPAGTATYTITLTDKGGLTHEHDVVVNVEAKLTQSLTGVLFNSAGQAGTGGLDLDSGDGTGSSNIEAEIRDMGIDSFSTNEATEWRQRIGGINGAEVRFVGTQGLDSDFDAIASKEAVVGAFDGGLDFVAASTINDGGIDVWGNFKVSKKLEVGDIFAVQKGGTYYLVLVEEVVVEPGTNNNLDHYTMAIKY
jgi:hypothetical protein